MNIRLSPDLSLPLDYVTETTAILAKRGKGKTYTAAKITEELVTAGVPTVVVDPIGVWWGLRSSADGEGEGLPVAIFGGDHADLPLDEKSGEVVAEAIVAERFSAILDLSHMSKSAWRRFMTAFIARIYHANRDPLHLVIDEADSFAPQSRMTGDGAPLLGAMEDLVRRGRARGLGTTLITQRPAVLHKDVLTQAEVLICLGMTGVRDVAAIDEWVRLHADDDQAREVKKSLPGLPVGDAWVWSPGWLDILQKIHVEARETFDSSATPSVGQQRIVPKTMADIDLTALGEQITAAAETAKADDPKELKREIARLRREFEQQTPTVEHVKVPVLTDDDRDLLQRVADVTARVSDVLGAPVLQSRPAARPARTLQEFSDEVTQKLREGAAAESAAYNAGTTRLPKAQAAVIAVLAQHGPSTAVQVAMLAGYSSKGGGFRNALGALRSSGLIVGDADRLELTADGQAATTHVPPLPTGRALIDHWLNAVHGKAERLILTELIDAYASGRGLTKQQIATVTGYSPVGGGFRNALGRLRTLQLIHGRDEIHVADELGEAGLA